MNHVFEADPILPEKMIQVCFSDKPLLELSRKEASILLVELQEVLDDE